MKKLLVISACIATVSILYSCHKEQTTTSNTGEVYIDIPAKPHVYYADSNVVFADSLNRIATLGRVLFYDTRLSVNNAISCGSCHKQAAAFADQVALSVGFEGRLTSRNSMAISSPGFFLKRLTILGGSHSEFFWDGRERNLNNLALRPLTNHVEMGVEDSLDLITKLERMPYYSNLFANAYKDSKITTWRISDAIGTFMNAIVTDGSRVDLFNTGEATALSAQELYGKSLFDTKYNCSGCHNGGSYAGGGFMDIGLDAKYTDVGRSDVTKEPSDIGRFKVPNLHNVALTGPYMHDGRYKTLSEVLDHYSHNIKKSPNLDSRLKMGGEMGTEPLQMAISDDEKAAIIAFLNAFTDYKLVTDPKFSDPFKTTN